MADFCSESLEYVETKEHRFLRWVKSSYFDEINRFDWMLLEFGSLGKSKRASRLKVEAGGFHLGAMNRGPLRRRVSAWIGKALVTIAGVVPMFTADFTTKY
jgi:hypothetical protein